MVSTQSLRAGYKKKAGRVRFPGFEIPEIQELKENSEKQTMPTTRLTAREMFQKRIKNS